MLEILKKYTIVQWLFIIPIIIFFISMNIGIIKYNILWVSLPTIFGAFACLYLYNKYYNKFTLVISDKVYYYTLLLIFIVSFVGNALVVYNVPLAYYSDFIITRDQAIYLAKDYAIKPVFSDYYHSYPFNINNVVIIGWLYKLTGNYHHVEMITSTLVNVAAVLTGMTVRNFTGKRILAIVVAIVYEFYSMFCLKTYMPYSSNLVMIFPILIVYIYSGNFNRYLKIFLMVLIAAIGYRIKFTALIPLIGIVIIEGYSVCKNKDLRSVSVFVFSILLCFGVTTYARQCVLDKIKYEPDPTIEHNIIFYLAMGQNNEYGGQYYKPIADIGDIHRPKAERDELFLQMAIDEFKSRSLVGQIKFFMGKIAICWGEMRQDHLKFCCMDSFLLSIRLLTWYLALLGMSLGVFLMKDKRFYSLLLGIFGSIAYLYLSEAGARYVIMYSPIVYVMMGWVLALIKK